MPQEQMQAPQQDPTQVGTDQQTPVGLSEDELAAALGFITTLGEQHHMAQQGMQEQQGQQDQPDTESKSEDTAEPTEEPADKPDPAAEIDKKLEDMKGELEKTLEEKIGALSKTIEEALKEDDNED